MLLDADVPGSVQDIYHVQRFAACEESLRMQHLFTGDASIVAGAGGVCSDLHGIFQVNRSCGAGTAGTTGCSCKFNTYAHRLINNIVLFFQRSPLSGGLGCGM